MPCLANAQCPVWPVCPVWPRTPHVTEKGYISNAVIATAKTLRTLLRAETIDFIAYCFFLLPTSIGLLLYIGIILSKLSGTIALHSENYYSDAKVNDIICQ
jgi:hypothetical protein